MTLQMGVVCLVLLGLSTALVCPDGGMCEDRNTCCENGQGGYGCCPLPHAECCSDHLHCCYEGTVCDLVHQRCVNKTASLPWMRRLPPNQAPLESQLEGKVKAVICPDQESECPDDTTCCQLPDGSWGCCPLPKAVCCEDKRHCCPEGTTCDITHSKCVSSSLESSPMLQKLPAKRIESKPASAAGSVTCPGEKSSCPDGYTCCLLPAGDYGCCPYAEATCCSDHLHCCPSNTICDLEHGSCKSGETHMPLMKKVSAKPNDVVCPDKESDCPDLTTCCQMTNETYGCCPLPHAVCCADHMHCCPAYTRCDLLHSTCTPTQGAAAVPVRMLAAGTERVATQSKVHAVPCNDSVACADGSTCCKASQGQWACCPLPQAVCCEDHLHCCPRGTVCNLAASTCDDRSGGAVVPLLAKTPVFPLQPDNSKCDKSTSCPGKATCCKTLSGDWACCPLPQAVCCDDHEHCCPHGTVCNLEAETCDDPSGSSPSLSWLAKVAALTSQAVCCDDHQHCCPSGYACNAAAQTCDQPGGLRLPWLQKVPARQARLSLALSAGARPDKNMCDAQTSCPRDTTCCFMEQTHKWGCCPLPKAVCCKDGNHCCPSGHTCEPHRSSCSRGPRVTPWFTKLSARMEAGAVTDVKCDNKSSCATGATCCKLQTGEWGCCPLVKAVCCADHEHCCPQGYTCNMQTGTCEKKAFDLLLHTLPQSKVVRSDLRGSEEDGDVSCDGGGEFRCPEQHTCCRTSATEWSCCPFPGAVCCADAAHCCPAGYSCDLKAGGCTRLTWDALLGDRKTDFVPRGL
ncbi:granulin b isoform 1-T2 [Odontesthes bonariensis]|uniref:granulin b n=1 Tax=Odontesthes bonariensis TaxID=219752 RepID=UPI003F5856E4